MLPLEDRELLTQTMVGLNIDAGTITSLMSSFETAADGMEKDEVTPVSSTSFGGSYTGSYRLGTNVQMAHEAVAHELKKMAAGLRGMSSSVQAFGKDMETTTEQTVASMSLLEASTECIAAPAFDAGTCTLPTENQD